MILVAMVWHGVDLRWAYTDLLGSIQRRTGCVQRAYDILHDSLIRLALVRCDTPIPQPHAYLRVVVGNVIVDRYKDEARWVEIPDEESARAVFDHAPSAEHLAWLNQRLRFMQTILDCLPPRCREVFWFFCVEGYTQPEIAARLGISQKVVERHVARAMIDIRAARQEILA